MSLSPPLVCPAWSCLALAWLGSPWLVPPVLSNKISLLPVSSALPTRGVDAFSFLIPPFILRPRPFQRRTFFFVCCQALFALPILAKRSGEDHPEHSPAVINSSSNRHERKLPHSPRIPKRLYCPTVFAHSPSAAPRFLQSSRQQDVFHFPRSSNKKRK